MSSYPIDTKVPPIDPRLALVPSYILRARFGRAGPGNGPGVI